MELRRIQLLILLGGVVPLLAQDISIGNFSVQQTSTSVRLTLVLSDAVTVRSGCFFDKLTFGPNLATTPTTGFAPSNEGTCEFNNTASNIIVGTMDIADYAALLQFQIFTSVGDIYIITRGKSPVSLVPGISVTALSTPIPAAAYIPYTRSPVLISFDIDLITNRLLLHFDSLMDSSSLNLSQLNLSSTSSLSEGMSLMSSSPVNVAYSTTQCITLSAPDLVILDEEGICGSPSSCFCFFSSELISAYTQVPVIESSGPVQVSILRRSSTPSSPVYMILSLLYLGCNATHTLTDDEVYILRPYEYVTRIDCFTNVATNSSNIRPRISREPSFSGSAGANIEDYVGYDWPLNTYLNFSRALPSQLYGQYVCRSSIGYYTRNYVHDSNFGIELPDGSIYRLPLHNPLAIPFYFGSYPHTSLLRPDITIMLYDLETRSPVAIEPTYERINPFHIDIKYSMVQRVLGGDYEIRIREGVTTIAMQPITIEVTGPTLTLVPEVAIILPGQEQIVLMCTANSASLLVRWYSASSPIPLSSNTTYTVEVSPDTASTQYNCSVTDPVTGTIVATAVVPVRRIQVNQTLSVFREGMLIDNNSRIVIANNRNGDLNLQCVEQVESDLTWLILPNNGSLVIPSDVKGDSDYIAIESGNQATLTIENSVEPFRGLLKCISLSGQVVNILVVADGVVPLTCKEEVDSAWGVRWNETVAGSRDFQPCPTTGARTTTFGFVLRECSMDGEWNDTVDITNCSSANYIDLERMGETMLFELRKAYSQVELSGLVSQLIRDLKTITQPKLTTYFPMDLDIANNILENLVNLLSEESLPMTHVDLVDVLDNLLHMNNIEGWRLLTESNNGGQRLLNISEAYGVYLLESLQIRGSQSGNELTVPGETGTIVYSAMIINDYEQDLTYPADLSNGAQITLPANLLSDVQATGAVHIVMQNLGEILPKPNRTSDTFCVASRIISSQITTASGIISSFNGSEAITLEFITEGVPRATDPVCLFFDASAPSGQWSTLGVETILPVNQIVRGEVKQFSVTCSSNHLTAFGVAVDVETSDFNFTVPVYVGCGFVIFSSALSIFSLLLSYLCDKLRIYSVVAFLIHLSFIASLLCAYVAFLAGIEQALNHRIGCVAVAGLLHYFFTAAFTWLLIEGLLLIFFKTFSNYCGLFVIIFILGWGLPAIPTAISLGVLHQDYGTVSGLNCWFFFDGQFTGVVLGFIVPKLIIIVATLSILLIGCCTNCKFSKKKMQPMIKEKVSQLLWWIWFSVTMFLILLSASWVFAMLLVNVYGLDSEILGWVFMAASILLSMWMFIFSVTIMVINQRVDYERVWREPDPIYPQTDPGRGKGYQFMDMPSVDLSGKRTSTLTRPPRVLSNPVFGTM